MTAFDRDALDALFKELESAYGGSSEYERILRDAHLGVALLDGGQEVAERIDPRAATAIKKHRPK